MKWKKRGDNHGARCGHLFVRIEENEAYGTVGKENYEPASFTWFVEPDQEDKSYRRALAGDESKPTLDEAKKAAESACKQLIAEMKADLEKS